MSSDPARFVGKVIVSIEHRRSLLPLFFPIKASCCLLTNVVRHMQEMLSWYRGSIKQETMSLTLPFVWQNDFWRMLINGALLHTEDWRISGNSVVTHSRESVSAAERLQWCHHADRKQKQWDKNKYDFSRLPVMHPSHLIDFYTSFPGYLLSVPFCSIFCNRSATHAALKFSQTRWLASRNRLFIFFGIQKKKNWALKIVFLFLKRNKCL